MKPFLLPTAILITGLLYIFVIPQDNSVIKLLFKITPMILLISYAIKMQTLTKSKYKMFILAGLLFCTLGDSFIIFSFVFGLAAFLVGHLFYIPAFVLNWNFSWLRFLTIVPLAVYGFLFGSEIIASLTENNQQDLIVPVIIYIVVIASMGWTAMMSGSKNVMLGSILFIISDSILSWDKFVYPLPFGGELIMLTYYSAQFFIARSISDTYGKRDSYHSPIQSIKTD